MLGVKHNVLLSVMSLFSILLMTLHLSDDMVRGFSTPGLDNLIGVAILVVWLYGTLMLADRRAGYVIMLLGAFFAAAMPIVHMSGAGFGEAVRSSGGILFFWTVFTLGVTGTFSLILAARSLWDPQWAQSRLFSRSDP
jgi:hypothetical protein